MSKAMLEEMAWEWYQRGIRSTGEGFHGETAAMRSADMLRMIRIAFERLWARRHES